MTDTWVEVPDGSPFTIDNLPYGVFSTSSHGPRVEVAIGDHVLDAAPFFGEDVWASSSLNAFMAQGPIAWHDARRRLLDALGSSGANAAAASHLVPARDATLHLPFEVADYADFYASLSHAENCGRILRPDGEPLTPNWRHMPLGYHGRAGTVVVSGTPVVRPHGQRREVPDAPPSFGPSQRLDIEAEVGFVVGVPTAGSARSLESFKSTIGCFVNALPMRADLAGNPPFRSFLAQLRRTVLGALEQ